MVTPDQRHTGQDKVIYEKRAQTMAGFYEKHPERFVQGLPQPPQLPGDVWINKPKQAEAEAA